MKFTNSPPPACTVSDNAGSCTIAADQSLHRRIAAARIDELDVEALFGEMAAGPRYFVGNDAEQLTAESEPQFSGGGICVWAAGAHRDYAGHPDEPFESRTPVPL